MTCIVTQEEQDRLLSSQTCPDSWQEYVSSLTSTTEDNQDTSEFSSSSPDTPPAAYSTLTADPQPDAQSPNPHKAAPTQLSRSSTKISSHGPALADVTYGSIELLSPWFPQIDPVSKRAKTFVTWKSRRDVVLWIAFTTIFLVFVINLVLTILSWTRLSNDTPDKYLRNLYTGDCATVRRGSVLAHLFINILSTLMLSASNLCLQLVSAPTRADLDKAHKKGIWLDIGVPTLRNLKHIPRRRTLIWCVLGISSLPIHFLYNSAVISSFTMNSYAYLIVTEDFFAQPFSNASITGSEDLVPDSFSYNATYDGSSLSPIVSRMAADYHDYAGNFTNLSTLEGLRAYSQPFAWRPNLFAIAAFTNVSKLLPNAPNCSSSPCTVTANNINASLLDYGLYEPTNMGAGGLCVRAPQVVGGGCHRLSKWTDDDAKDWAMGLPYGFHIRYFRVNQHIVTDSAISQQLCHLQCSPVLFLVVTIFNLVKCLCILWVIFASDGSTICTLGDAIATFLEYPDVNTKDYGVANWESFTRKAEIVSSRRFTAKTQSRLWASASSNTRWLWTTLGFMSVITFALICTIQGIWIQKKYSGDASFTNLWQLGFGTARHEELISWGQPNEGSLGLFVNIIVANVWQVLVSMLYLVFNAILSCQLLAAEWGRYGYERKTLRVSHPIGIQRGSFFISMPLRYGLPIIAVFSILHWLISQSAFVIRVVQFDWNGNSLPGFTMAGFSIIPCLTASILGILCLSGYILTSIFRHYSYVPGMPFASTCSLAISASCHRPERDYEAHLLPVQWGIYEEDSGIGAKCAFTTSRHVRTPDVDDELCGIPTSFRKDARMTLNWKWYLEFGIQFWRAGIKKYQRKEDR